MNDDSQTATPENSGNDESAANKSNYQGKNKPEKKIKPRQWKSKKWFGLPQSKWREFFGYVVLIPWLWYDLIDSHDISKLVLLAISLAIGQGVACSFLNSRSKILTLWLISLIPVSVVVWENSRPIKIDLILITSHSPNNILWLTNDFLIRHDPGINKEQVFSTNDAWVSIPFRPEETNVILNFGIVNLLPTIIYDPEIAVIFSPKIPLIISPEWSTGGLPGLDSAYPEWQLANSPIDRLFSGSWQPLPQIGINPRIWSGTHLIHVSVRMRGNNLPSSIITFWLIFVETPIGTNTSSPQIIPPENVEVTKNGTNWEWKLKFP